MPPKKPPPDNLPAEDDSPTTSPGKLGQNKPNWESRGASSSVNNSNTSTKLIVAGAIILIGAIGGSIWLFYSNRQSQPSPTQDKNNKKTKQATTTKKSKQKKISTSTRDKTRISDLNKIKKALEQFYSKNKAYPTTTGLARSTSENFPLNQLVESGLLQSKNLQDPKDKKGWFYGYKSIQGDAYQLTCRLENKSSPKCNSQELKKNQMCIYRIQKSAPVKVSADISKWPVYKNSKSNFQIKVAPPWQWQENKNPHQGFYAILNTEEGVWGPTIGIASFSYPKKNESQALKDALNYTEKELQESLNNNKKNKEKIKTKKIKKESINNHNAYKLQYTTHSKSLREGEVFSQSVTKNITYLIAHKEIVVKVWYTSTYDMGYKKYQQNNSRNKVPRQQFHKMIKTIQFKPIK